MSMNRRLLSYPFVAALAVVAAAAGHALGVGTGARYALAATMLAVGVAALLIWSERLPFAPAAKHRSALRIWLDRKRELELGNAALTHYLTRDELGLRRSEAQSAPGPSQPAHAFWIPAPAAHHSIWLRPQGGDLLVGGRSERERKEYARVLFPRSRPVYLLLAPRHGKSLGEVKVPNLARDFVDQDVFVWWFDDVSDLPEDDADAIAASAHYADRATRALWLKAAEERPEDDAIRTALTEVAGQS